LIVAIVQVGHNPSAQLFQIGFHVNQLFNVFFCLNSWLDLDFKTLDEFDDFLACLFGDTLLDKDIHLYCAMGGGFDFLEVQKLRALGKRAENMTQPSCSVLHLMIESSTYAAD